MSSRKLIDEAEVLQILVISEDQLDRLDSSPVFPKSVRVGRQEKWHLDEIKAFRRRLIECGLKGYLVPDALYAWTFDAPRPWKLIKLRRKAGNKERETR